MRKTVYIVGPYTLGDLDDNMTLQMETASQLIDLGYAPYWPLGWHFIDRKHPKSYETWMEVDSEYVTVCDYLLRLGGESPGADREVALAVRFNIPVFLSVDELVEYTDEKQQNAVS